jgi:surface protein
MAIIQAQAKLYQGFRSYVVDKNISANLSAAFTVGNQNQPSPTLDGNGNIILQSGVKVFKIVRTIADLFVSPSVSLTNERYKTYGGGNNVINANGSVDNTNNSKIISTLVCSFPTFFRLDLEALGLPEGTDCVVKLEEGFVIEDRGLIRASGTYPYPLAVSNPNPASDSFATFRTPKTFAKKALSVVSSLSYNTIGRLRPLAATITGAMTFVASGVLRNASGISIENATFTIIPQAVKRAVGTAIMNSVSTISAPFIRAREFFINPTLTSVISVINKRVRFFDINTDIVSFLNPQTLTSRIRNTSSVVSMSASLSATGAANRNFANINNTMIFTLFNNYDVYKILDPQTISATSSLSCVATMPLVFTTGGVLNQEFLIQGTQANVNTGLTIDWGNGTVEPIILNASGNYFYLGAPANTKVKIYGTAINGGIIRIGQNSISAINTYGDGLGQTRLPRFDGYNAYSVPNHIPASITDISSLFANNQYFNDVNVIYWNTSNITNMGGMFDFCFNFNQDISGWNTSNVTNMGSMFRGAFSFQQPIQSWDTSKVTSMIAMFDMSQNYQYAGLTQGVFNQPIGSWNTSNVVNMSLMFAGCQHFNQSLASWDASKVTSMAYMFRSTGTFNNSIPTNTPLLTNIEAMFYRANSFNHSSVSNLNVSNVTTLYRTFYQSRVTQNLSSWNTGNVTTMEQMYGGLQDQMSQAAVGLSNWDVSKVTNFAYAFNYTLVSSNLSAWNTSSATNMEYMFYQNRPGSSIGDLGNWDVSKVTNFNNMWAPNGTLNNWNVSSATNMIGMFSYSGFNSNIASWNVSKVKYFAGMLRSSTYNQPMPNWNVSGSNQNNSSTTSSTFFQMLGISFNQDISGWTINTQYPTNLSDMFDGNQSMSQVNKNKALVSFANQVYNGSGAARGGTIGWTIIPSSTTYTGSPFNNGIAAKAYLINTGAHPTGAGWTVS